MECRFDPTKRIYQTFSLTRLILLTNNDGFLNGDIHDSAMGIHRPSADCRDR
jgi:hypothetical protein